jgi:hypothetical protein
VYVCLLANKQQRKSKQTNTHATNKINKGKQLRKKRWKLAECDHVGKKGQKTNEADSFRHNKIKYPTDLKMAM